MSPPDRRLLPFPKTPPQRLPGQRDPRIDAFRGLALAMIFVNHIPGNPYEVLTTRNFGFSDAAEAFFVMSGIAAGLAYAGRFLPAGRARAGLWPAVAPVWSRAWVLYLAHLFLTLWAIALFAFGAELFRDPALLAMHNLRPIVTDPQEVLFGLPTLGHQIGYVNILPVYMILLLALPGMLLLALRWPRATLALSVALWFAAGLWRVNLPTFPRPGEWPFNPFAWQLVFVVGLMIGLRMRAGARLVPRVPGLFWLAAGFLVLAAVWMHVPPLARELNHQLWRLGEMGAPFNIVSQDKIYLSLPRLLHILALVYVISCLPAVTRLTAHRLATPLRLMGRHGLLVFAAGTLMALAAQIVLIGLPDLPVLRWVLPPAGLLALWGIAVLAESSKATLARRRPPEAPPARAEEPAAARPPPRARPARA